VRGGLVIGLADPDPQLRLTSLLSMAHLWETLRAHPFSDTAAWAEDLAALWRSPLSMIMKAETSKGNWPRNFLNRLKLLLPKSWW